MRKIVLLTPGEVQIISMDGSERVMCLFPELYLFLGGGMRDRDHPTQKKVSDSRTLFDFSDCIEMRQCSVLVQPGHSPKVET